MAKALAITITSSMLTSIPFEANASVGKRISSKNMSIFAKSDTSGHYVADKTINEMYNMIVRIIGDDYKDSYN